MTKNHKKILIFDMDGTLYNFKKGSFKESGIYDKILENTLKYIQENLDTSEKFAKEKLDFIIKKYKDSISIGLEKEFGINRYDYFKSTWNFSPIPYIIKDTNIIEILCDLNKEYHLALLSDAPRIWIDNILNELKIKKYFEKNIFSGEKDNRKEFNNAFDLIIKKLGIDTENCFVIGDQEETDIIPARRLGLKTVYINKDKTSKVADYSIKNISELKEILL